VRASAAACSALTRACAQEEENQDGLEKLKAAHQQLKEDEEVGANTLRELARQREVLERTRNNVSVACD
jgi:hypothetical protein